MILRPGHVNRTLKVFCASLALAFPLTIAFAQSSSQQSSSSQDSGQAKSGPPSQPATLDPPPQKQDSLAEAARKAKTKKPDAATTKGKVYTEDDLKGMKGPGVSVVGDPPRKNTRRSQPADDPNGDNGGQNPEEYWRGRAREYLDAIAQVDEQIAQKKDEIKKYGSGGFDVTTGMKNNVAYINDRNAQLKQLEDRKSQLQQELEELQDEGRKAGAPASWFR